MSKTVLVPVDGSDPANAALDHALDQFTDGHIVVYHSVDSVDIASRRDPEALRGAPETEGDEQPGQLSERVLEAAEDRAADVQTEVELDTEVGPPAGNIVRYAEQRDVDHIVIGSHGRTGLTRVALGSVAEEVVRKASVPVTVVHPDTDD